MLFANGTKRSKKGGKEERSEKEKTRKRRGRTRGGTDFARGRMGMLKIDIIATRYPNVA